MSFAVKYQENWCLTCNNADWCTEKIKRAVQDPFTYLNSNCTSVIHINTHYKTTMRLHDVVAGFGLLLVLSTGKTISSINLYIKNGMILDNKKQKR